MTDITWPSPFGYSDFCDDIRQELFGKVTLVGIYSGELSIAGTPPVTLPKFVIFAHYFERPEDGAVPLQLRVYLPGDPDDEPTTRIDIPARNHHTPDYLRGEDVRASMHFAHAFTPLVVTQPGAIRVRMQRGEDIVRLGSLHVRFINADEAAALGLTPAPTN